MAESSVVRAVRAALAELTASVAAPPRVDTAEARERRIRRATRPGSKRLAAMPQNRTRWLQRDVETAQDMAANGDLSLAAQLYRSLRRDGMVQGLSATRHGGLVRLPRRFSGDAQAVAYFDGSEGTKGRFGAIFPASELQLLAADRTVLGVGLAQLVQPPSLSHPVLVRLDPEYLRYRWHEDRWYYNAMTGPIGIDPGNGEFILHTAGRQEPWNNGLIWALARGFVDKEAALYLRSNWNHKLANPARVAVAPTGAAEAQKQKWFREVMAWAINSVFGMTPGYDVRLLESNGRGYESFAETIKSANEEFMIALAGQVVTVTGGSGFQNANVYAMIRSDLIRADGDALAETLTAQALPHVLPPELFPIGADISVEWDTRPPKDMMAEAQALVQAAAAVEALRKLFPDLDEEALCGRLAIPRRGDLDGDGAPDQAQQIAPVVRLPMTPAQPVTWEDRDAA